MDCAIQNTWKWQFFFLSLHSSLLCFFIFSTRKKSNAFVYTKYSFTACDRHRQPFECSREEKKNLIVVFFVFIHSKHGFVYKMRSSYFHFIERKEKRFMNQHKDWWKWSETVLAVFFLNWMKNDCISARRTLIWLWLSTIGSPYFDFFKWFSSCKYSHVISINIFKDHLRIR